MIKHKLKLAIEVEFESYGNKRLDQKAIGCINKYILATLKNECGHIPLYIQKDENGSVLEDATKKLKIQVI